MKNAKWLIALVALGACSPLKTSPHDEKHQLELTLHAVQTNIDDFRHQINCFQSELQILDGRIKYNENALAAFKQEGIETQKTKLDALAQQMQTLEKKWTVLEQNRTGESREIQQLTAHAQETTTAFTQFKQRIEELEKELLTYQRKLEQFAKVKGSLETLTKSMSSKTHRVQSGESLKKIANLHGTSVEKLKRLNNLDHDKIVAGQELKIPSE